MWFLPSLQSVESEHIIFFTKCSNAHQYIQLGTCNKKSVHTLHTISLPLHTCVHISYLLETQDIVNNMSSNATQWPLSCHCLTNNVLDIFKTALVQA